jgi:hypothetical protein
MKRLNRVIGIAAALLIGTFVTQATTYAQVGQDPQSNARNSRIVGLWDVQVTNTICATGATLTTFPALHKFELGGTGQVVPSTNPTGLSAHMMIWSHVESNDYLMAVKMFRFDAVGNTKTPMSTLDPASHRFSTQPETRLGEAVRPSWEPASPESRN